MILSHERAQIKSSRPNVVAVLSFVRGMVHKKSHKKPNSYTKAKKKNKTDQKTCRKEAKVRYLFRTCPFKIIDIAGAIIA